MEESLQKALLNKERKDRAAIRNALFGGGDPTSTLAQQKAEALSDRERKSAVFGGEQEGRKLQNPVLNPMSLSTLKKIAKEHKS